MHGRRTAAGLIATMVAVGSLVAGTAADAKPKPKLRPNLGVAGILGAPALIRAGGHFGVKVMVVNEGTARSRASVVSVHLSRDAKKSKGDLNVGRADVGEIDDWKHETVPVRIDLPESAIGSYYVIACADATRKVRETKETDNCNAGSSQVEVVVPLEGTLTGTLDLYSSDELESGNTYESWGRHAQAEIDVEVSGRGDDINVVDKHSRYSWGGDHELTVQYPECVSKQSEAEEKATSDFRKAGQRLSALQGSTESPTLDSIDLMMEMQYDVTGSMSSCGEAPVPYTYSTEYQTGLALERVSATDDTITYRVASDWTGTGVGSQWDAIEGKLTLHLG